MMKLFHSIEELHEVANSVAQSMTFEDLFDASREIRQKPASELTEEDMECLTVIYMVERLAMNELQDEVREDA